MAGLGQIYVELDLDWTPFQKAGERLKAEATAAATTIEGNFKRLGVTSDTVFQAMANKAVLSFDSIKTGGKASAAEIERSYTAMVAKINALNQDMTKNPLFETMGLRSVAAINAQKAAVISSYETIKKSGTATAQDLINIERAKNAKLKELNAEMVGSHEMSMASLTRALLRFYAAWYVISAGAQQLSSFFMSGIKAIDDMKVSTIGVAAQITTMQGATGDIAKNYKENLKYAEALIPVLQQIDANSFANLSQIQKMNMAMSMQGTILDVNNKKQIDSFTALTNAVALFTQGQDKEKQASQEIRALFSGQVKQGDMVALMIDQQIKRTGDYKDGLKGLVEEGRKFGDTLERLNPYLTGIIAASGDIQSTWMAVSSSIETTWNIIQRGLFKDAYKSLVESGQSATAWLKQNQDEVTQYMRIAWVFIADSFMSAWNILKGFGPVLKDFAMLLGPIAYGWGGVLASMKPISEAIGNAIEMTYALGKAIATASMAAALLASGNYMGAKLYWDEAQKGFSKVNELTKKNFELITKGVADSIVKYDEQYKAATKAAGGATSPKIPKGADTEGKDKANQIRLANLAEATAENREYYDGLIEQSNHWLRMSKIGGQSDLDGTVQVINDKKIALNEWYDLQSASLIKFQDKSKLGQVVLAKDEEKLWKEYSKSWDRIENEKAETSAKIQQKAYDDSVKLMMDEINMGVKLTEESMRRPQKEADEARKMVTFYNDIRGMEAEYRNAKFEWIEKEAALKKSKGEEEVAVMRWVAQQRDMLNREYIKGVGEKFDYDTQYVKETITNTGQMLDAAMSMYDKESSEYKRLSEWKKAIMIADLAMTAAKNLQIIASNIALMTSNAGLAVSNAGTAVTGAAIGVGPLGFATAAAMIALMASVFAAYGIASGAGTASVSVPPPPMTASGMSSTVLGGATDQESESIKNSLEMLDDILGDTYDLEYRELRGIHSSMKQLNDNITGLVRGLVAGGGNLNSPLAMQQFAGFSNQGMRDLTQTFSDNMSMGAIRNLNPIADFLLKIEPLTGMMSLLPKLFGDMFGGRRETYQIGAGVQFQPGSVGGLQGGANVGAQNWLTQGFYESGGWFGSDKNWSETYYAQANEEVTRLLTQVYKNMGDTLVELTIGLGQDMSKTLAYSFGNASFNLQGMSGEQINKTLKDFFSQAGDTAVMALFGTLLTQYQKVGEGLFETAVRVMQDKAVIVEALKMTRQAFTGTIPDLIAFSESVITMAGGLDKFMEATSYYYDSFFNDAEKMIRSREQMTEAFTDMNLAMPQSRNAYRDLVEGLDLMTESGKEAYVAMLMMAEGADKYYDMLDEIMEKLRSARESMRLEGMAYSQKMATAAQLSLMTVLDQARTGNFANIGSLDSSLSELTSSASSSNLFATRQEYEANFYRTYNRLAELEGLVGGTIPIEEQQLAVLQQIAANTDPNAVATAATAPFTSKYDTMSTAELFAEWVRTFMGGVFPGGMLIPSADSMRGQLKSNFPGMASGGDFGGGWRMVGEQGPELEYTGASRIFSNKDSKSLVDNSELVNEVKQLRQELYAATYQIAKNTAKSAKITDRWDIDGLPPERTA